MREHETCQWVLQLDKLKSRTNDKGPFMRTSQAAENFVL